MPENQPPPPGQPPPQPQIPCMATASSVPVEGQKQCHKCGKWHEFIEGLGEAIGEAKFGQ